MKKIISLLLILMLVFTLSISIVSCGDDTPDDDPPEVTDEPEVPGVSEGFELPPIMLPDF